MRHKKVITITAVAIVIAVVVLTISTAGKNTKVDYSLIDMQKNEKPLYTNEDLSKENLIVLGESNGKKLLYQRDITAFFIYDSSSNIKYSSGINPYVSSNILIDKNMYTVCQVGFTDFNGSNDVFTNQTSNCKILERKITNGISLGMWFEDYKIGFTVDVSLNKYGLKAKIPSKSIIEKGKYGITSITLFPMMGAVENNEEGFIIYPDGSGSLYKFGRNKELNPVSKPVYFDSSFDLDQVEKNELQHDYSVLLPCYSITDGNSGVISYVTEGDTNAYITLYPSGLNYNLNRIAASCMYRKSYSYVSPSNVEINEVEKNISASDYSIQYLFISKSGLEKSISYGMIADRVRKYMLQTDKMNSNIETDEKYKINLQILMGARIKSGISKSFKTLTTCSQVKNITDSIDEDKLKSVRLYLLGWQYGGYGLYPSGDTISKSLGTINDFKKLNDYTLKNGIKTYAVVDYISAMNSGKGFNKNSQAVYNEMNLPITNSNYDNYLLNPLIELDKFVNSRLPYLNKLGFNGIGLEKAGSYLYDDYGKNRKLSRLQCSQSFDSFSKYANKFKINTAVQGGNAYMLPHADVLYDLPENNSGNINMTYAIPFYQMVVHGVIPYCSSLPGNMAADFNKQKLKWIEYGSQPTFVLTFKSSELLKNTYTNNVFSTEYQEQCDNINKCIEEFDSKLKFTFTEAIMDHQVISKDIVKVTYGSGKVIFINYGQNNVNIDGIQVNAEDYVVTEGENDK